MAIVNEISEAIKSSLMEMATGLGDFIPKLIVAFVIIIIGIIAAKVLKVILTKLFQGVKLDNILEKTGTTGALHKMGITGSISILIPTLIYYFIVIFMVKVASSSAGFTEISQFIENIFAFTPKVLMAFIIMVVGMLVSDLIYKAVFNILDAKGLDYASTISNLGFAFSFVIFLTVALSQIGIETELLKASVKIILAGFALAVAICLGFGLKEHASNIVAAVYARDIYRKGTNIDIDGKLMEIISVGPVTTKLTNDSGEFVVIPNTEIVSKITKGRVKES